MRITAETLRRASFGWNKLNLRFPRVLPKIVDDIDAWRRMAPKLLEILTRAVHEALSPPPSLFGLEFGFSRSTVEQAKRLARSNPQLGSLLDALSWDLCLTPARSVRILSWLEVHCKLVEGVLANSPGLAGLAAAIGLSNVAAFHGERRAAPILAVLGCPDGNHVPTRGGREYVKAWLALGARSLRRMQPRDIAWPERPAATWHSCVFEIGRSYFSQSPKAGRIMLDLFGTVFPDDLLLRWRRWWEQVDQETAALRRLILTSEYDTRQPPAQMDEDARAIAVRLGTLVSDSPPEFVEPYWFGSAGGWPRVLSELAQPGQESVRSPLLRILKCVDVQRSQSLPRAKIVAAIAMWIVGTSPWDDRSQPAKLSQVLRVLPSVGILGNRLDRVICDDDFDDLLQHAASVPRAGDFDLERACRAIAYWVGELKQTVRLSWPIAVSRATSDMKKIDTYLRNWRERSLRNRISRLTRLTLPQVLRHTIPTSPKTCALRRKP